MINERIRNLKFSGSTLPNSLSQEITQLNRLMEDGLITKEEFERAKGLFLGKPKETRDDIITLLKDLYPLYKTNVLSEYEFNQKKWEILSRTKL